jgi:hypothetical protein
VVTELDTTQKPDFPNIVTIWHTEKLIKAILSLFPRSNSPAASTTDPYDIVHAFYLLTTLCSKSNVSISKGQDYNSPINKKIMIQNSAKDFPACGDSIGGDA